MLRTTLRASTPVGRSFTPRTTRAPTFLAFAAPIAREATINLHKRLHKISYKKRAPRAVREIKKFAAQLMGTKVRT